MLLTDARRPARTGAGGELVPLAEQDRTLWDRGRIAEGVSIITEAIRRKQLGEYQVQAAIAAVHDQAARDDTEWPEIVALYRVLERMTANPMVTLNRAVATAMASGPGAGLALLRRSGRGSATIIACTRCAPLARAERRYPGPRSPSSGPRRPHGHVREQQYLTLRASRLRDERLDGRSVLQASTKINFPRT